MHMVGEVDGRIVDVETFLEQLEDDESRSVLRRLTTSLHSVESVPCPVHHQAPGIVLAGTSLGQVSVEVVTCCDQSAETINTTIHAELQHRASSSWLRTWDRVRARVSSLTH